MAAKAMHIMISCENFIIARLELEMGSPGARITMGCSVGFESVKMESVVVGILAFANNP